MKLLAFYFLVACPWLSPSERGPFPTFAACRHAQSAVRLQAAFGGYLPTTKVGVSECYAKRTGESRGSLRDQWGQGRVGQGGSGTAESSSAGPAGGSMTGSDT